MTLRIGVITPRQPGGETGGAERFYDALVDAFRGLGHDAEEVFVPSDESDFERIKRNYLACYDLDVRRFDMVVSTKAPTWLIRHPRHVCYLVHTIRVFYDMFEEAFGQSGAGARAQRDLIHRLDTGALSPPRCKAVFSIGEEVSGRLRAASGLDAEVLHPPLWSDAFHSGEAGDYLLLPGRLHPWKRVDLAIRAMRHATAPVRLKISGVGEAEAELRALAAGDSRIEFLGRVDDARLVMLYAGSMGALFVPKREDYGYITLESFASGKPVITCEDSGEAAALVASQDGGIVAAPTPEALGAAIDSLHADPARAAAMGANGERWVRGLSWARIAQRLVDAAMGGHA